VAHAQQALNPTPAQHPKKEELHLVVGVMSHHDTPTPDALGSPRQECVPAVARRHFNRDAALGSNAPNRLTADRARPVKPPSEVPNETFILAAGPSTEPVVEMDYLQFPSPRGRQLSEQVEE
jgi:hypothetical protein